MNRNGTYILLFSIVTAICFIWLASWLASRKITQPLQKITQTAKRINSGQLDEEIKIKSQAAEIQDLAESLTLMSRRFRLDIRELKRLTSFQNEFLGNVSHEVRNPIFAIGGYIEALGADNLTPKMRQIYVGKGLNNVQRLNGLFSDLLEIARLEYREETIKPESFDLKALLDEVADELDYLAQEKSLELVVDNEPQKVYADRSRVRQVLTNLLQNGLKYTDVAHGVVRVRYRKNGNKVRIEVLDNGRGIPEEHLDHIFERFYRVDAARSRAMGGTGLGLSIVKQILNAHGEQIYVESTEGRGSRFWFELPISAPVPSANSI
ncbi:MAG: HAMP domain-containing protein [Rhodothermia bacterium]|nr:HAMP domain-containing protein [Rhodothermia bacterium]